MLISSLAGRAQSFEFDAGRDIPDGDGSGLVEVRTLPSAGAAMASLTVTLHLTPMGQGGFVGDLYATLAHEDGGYAVLLNRPGRQAGRPFGYSDDVPVSITLADGAPADVHEYRLTLTGDPWVPLDEALTGLWQPDARAVDPFVVTTTSPREAFLRSFVGGELGGRWTLFVADLVPGDEYRLDSWALSVSRVPEPSELLATLGLSALGWVVLRRLVPRA